MPARSRAALIAIPPSSAALKSLSDPSSRPIGVLAPPTITASPMAATILQVAGITPRGKRMLTRIDHVGIACRDLAAKVEFYESVFGLTVVSVETNEEQGVREAMLAVAE